MDDSFEGEEQYQTSDLVEEESLMPCDNDSNESNANESMKFNVHKDR